MKINYRKSFFIALILIATVFSLSSYALLYGASDPSNRSLNARVVGMGRAFVGLADDTSAIYINPSGLARKEEWQATSMSSRFMDAYNYLSFAGYYPTNYGVLGLGYGGYTIGGAYTTTIESGSNPNDPIYKIDYTRPEINNYSNVILLSYANGADKLLRNTLFYQPWFDRLNLGMNFKIFSAGMAGGGIANGAGTGNELDVGMQYAFSPSTKFGLLVQDLLPASWGGRIGFLNGHTETFPAMLKAGAMISLLGEQDSFLKFRKQEVSLLCDVDSHPTIPQIPLVYHLGLEWNPNLGIEAMGLRWNPYNMLFVRLGLDQTTGDDGTGKVTAQSYMTYGVGFYYAGFRFDFAFHQLPTVAINSSYFSLTYSPVIPGKIETKESVKITEPKDQDMVFDKAVRVKGQVVNFDVKSIEINKSKIVLSKNGAFDAEVPLLVGKNPIAVNSYGEKGKLIETQKIRLLRLMSFPDVPSGYWARTPISLISMLNIVTGYPDGKFKPEGNITRSEMAALLMRAGKPAVMLSKPVPAFKDVNEKFWAAKFIKDAAAYGVVEGYSDGSFKPKGNITRAEGLAMISRFAGVSQLEYKVQYFPDITATYWAAPIISGASQAGLLEYLKGKKFEPKKKLMRAEAVEMLSRTMFVKNLLSKDLTNWAVY